MNHLFSARPKCQSIDTRTARKAQPHTNYGAHVLPALPLGVLLLPRTIKTATIDDDGCQTSNESKHRGCKKQATCTSSFTTHIAADSLSFILKRAPVTSPHFIISNQGVNKPLVRFFVLFSCGCFNAFCDELFSYVLIF